MLSVPGLGVSLLEFERFPDSGLGFANSGLEKGTGGDDDEVGGARVNCEVVPGFGQ
jgi:hypothetical protein